MKNPMLDTNTNGLTFSEWLAAAGAKVVGGWPPVGRDVLPLLRVAKKAWEAGEDPSDYRADGTFREGSVDPDSQCREHGCARWQCGAEH